MSGNTSKAESYFFSAEAAYLYDATIRAVIPNYDLLCETIMALVMAWKNSTGGRTPLLFLDLGAGTGEAALSFLNRIPNSMVVAVDHSSRMAEVYYSKLMKLDKRNAERSTYVLWDFRHPDTVEVFREIVRRIDRDKAGMFDCVVSGFTLHHLAKQERESVFTSIASLLRCGGLFLNADLFSYQSRKLSQVAEDYEVTYISRSFEELAYADVLQPKHVKALREKWVQHYRNSNHLSPIESGWILGERSVEGQAKQLLRTGFSEVGCPYRYMQTGILWAKR